MGVVPETDNLERIWGRMRRRTLAEEGGGDIGGTGDGYLEGCGDAANERLEPNIEPEPKRIPLLFMIICHCHCHRQFKFEIWI